jgi:glycosyltransferase involved in cell wall biosynthesis
VSVTKEKKCHMNRILILADVPGWAYDRRAKALKKYAPSGWEVDVKYGGELKLIDFLPYDLVFDIDYSAAAGTKQWLRNSGSKAKFVVSHNADERRCRELYSRNQQLADLVIFNNHAAYHSFGSPPGSCNISNGVDLEDFYPTGQDRSDSALWTGGEGKKGHKDFLVPFCEKCPEVNVKTKPVQAGSWKDGFPTDELWGTDRMRDFYNGSKVVLCFSETDATPNYVLEGMACGLVPVTVRVGNAMEFGRHNENLIFVDRDFNSFKTGIELAISDYDYLSSQALATISGWGWESRSKVFFDVFQRLIEGERIQPFSYMDA